MAVDAEIALAKANNTFPEQQEEMPMTDLPRGNFTVDNSEEAFALAASYFPNGIEYMVREYSNRGDLFYFAGLGSQLDLVVHCTEDNMHVEWIEVIDNALNCANKFPLSVMITGKKFYNDLSQAAEVAQPSNVSGKTSKEQKVVAKKAKKSALAVDKEQKWLKDAKVNEHGKYYIVPEIDYKGLEGNKSWNPCFYIVTNSLKLRRVSLQFAKTLFMRGQAIEIDKASVARIEDVTF